MKLARFSVACKQKIFPGAPEALHEPHPRLPAAGENVADASSLTAAAGRSHRDLCAALRAASMSLSKTSKANDCAVTQYT
jgi:hypothetical protein